MAEKKRRPSQLVVDSGPEDTRDRPEVIVEFLFDRGLLFISVRNIGARPANRIAITFDKKIIGLGGAKDISALALFRNIEFLGPGREIVTFLDTSGSYFQRRQPTKVSARISYVDDKKQEYEETIKHDLEIYRDLNYLASTTTKENEPSFCL